MTASTEKFTEADWIMQAEQRIADLENERKEIRAVMGDCLHVARWFLDWALYNEGPPPTWMQEAKQFVEDKADAILVKP